MAQARFARQTLGAIARELPVTALVLVIVAMMVIPVPPDLLDLLLTANLSLALLVLLVTMSTRKPLDFSAFPSVLLLTTLLRLALNVSSARLILLQGYAGHVIQGFGQFVVGGNPLVGFIIFLILVVIQYIVITRGAERVAEVAARFTLDAMPGKQMAIDADLSAGLIDEEQARARRQEIEREADFYGAMDGASKFVRGDAVAGLVIIAVNILGGLVVGLVERGLSFPAALQTYTLLTVGDGLVSQIPALLLSTAAGILVTRAAAAEASLGTELVTQVLAEPRVLYVLAAVLPAFGLVPGLPTWSFFSLGAGFFFLGRLTERSRAEAARRQEVTRRAEEKEAAHRPENVAGLLRVDPLTLELGYGLLPLADPAKGGDLLDRVGLLRRQMAMELGLVLSPVRIRDNLELKPDEYAVLVRGMRVGSGQILLGHYLAMDPSRTLPPVPGIPATEPVFGLPALWIRPADRPQAEAAGYTVVDPPSVIMTHLSEVVRSHAAELLTRQEVSALLEQVRRESPALVDELIPSQLTMGELSRVLKGLLAERVPIRDAVLILETIAEVLPEGRNTEFLVERVRAALARTLVHQFGLDKGVAPVLTLAPSLEAALLQSKGEVGPELAGRFLQDLSDKVQAMIQRGEEPVLLCSGAVRPLVRRLTERALPRLAVLSYSELLPETRVQPVGMVGG